MQMAKPGFRGDAAVADDAGGSSSAFEIAKPDEAR